MAFCLQRLSALIYYLTHDALVPWVCRDLRISAAVWVSWGCVVILVAVEVDGDVLEGFEGAGDAFDADSGGVLEVAGYG